MVIRLGTAAGFQRELHQTFCTSDPAKCCVMRVVPLELRSATDPDTNLLRHRLQESEYWR